MTITTSVATNTLGSPNDTVIANSTDGPESCTYSLRCDGYWPSTLSRNNQSTNLCNDYKSIVSSNEVMTNSTSIIINTVSIPSTNLSETGPITNTFQSYNASYLLPSHLNILGVKLKLKIILL